MMSRLSYLLVFVAHLLHQFVYGGSVMEYATCCELCDDDPCTEEQSKNCGDFDDNWSSCAECAPGYFYMGPEYACQSCQETAGCSDCSDYKGCNSCDGNEGVLTWSSTCGFMYCQGSTDTVHDYTSDTSDTSDTTTDTTSDTDTNTDSTTDSDTDTDETTDETSETTTDDDDDIIYIETEGAIASFSKKNIDGSVKVMHGHIIVNLDLRDFDFDDIYDNGGEDCFNKGLYFGIYDEWNYDENENKFGSDECSVEYTGYRYDPWLACSEYSNNEYCETTNKNTNNNNNDGCVVPSSWLDNPDDNGYICSKINYNENPFSCEIGDWSGKYGNVFYDKTNKSISGHYYSPYEVDSYDLSGKSIVFRCGNDKSRVFCAPFEEYEINDNKNEKESTYYREYQNLTYSQIAWLNGEKHSFIKLTYYQTFEISINVGELVIPGSCGDEIYYRIFNGQLNDNDNGDCDIDDLEHFYDPTITCDENSDNIDKGYCSDDDDNNNDDDDDDVLYTSLCWDNNYVYECELQDYEFTRFKCSPSDLSNKYGSINIEDTTSYQYNITGYDPLMIPLKYISGKSIVLQCSNNYDIIACGTFIDYKTDFGLGGTMSPDEYNNIIDNDSDSDDDDNDSDDDDDDDENDKEDAAVDSNFLGVSNEVGLIIGILLILSIFPCIQGIRKHRNKNKSIEDSVNKHHRKNKSNVSEDIMNTIHMSNRDLNRPQIERHESSHSRTYSSHSNRHISKPTVPAMQNDIGWMN